MFLQILVPQYKETEAIISNLLNSISMQQGFNFKDVEVLIANDGTDFILSKEFLNAYSFNIHYYLNEHKGVSATRQFLLDKAEADYVMFCDADDMFASNMALITIQSLLINNSTDILTTGFYEEMLKDNSLCYVKENIDKENKDGIFIHGKVFKREFLIENNIRWNEKLTVNEDSYFVALAWSIAKTRQHCPDPLYLWKFNKNSVTRNTADWAIKNYSQLIISNIDLVNEFLSRNLTYQAYVYIAQMLYNCYFTITDEKWLLQEFKEYKDLTYNLLYIYLSKFEGMFNLLSDDVKNKIYTNQKTNKIGNKELSITFEDWIKQIKERNF